MVPTSTPTSAPSAPVPTAAPTVPYCSVSPTGNPIATDLYTPGEVNYSVAQFNTTVGCVWTLHGGPNTTVVVNFSKILIDESSLGCRDCAASNCLTRPGYGTLSCDQAYQQSGITVCDVQAMQSICPSTCEVCGTCQYNYVTVSDSTGNYFRFCGNSTQSQVVLTAAQTVQVSVRRGYLQHPPLQFYTPIPLPPSDAVSFTWTTVTNTTATPIFICSGTTVLNASTGEIMSNSVGDYPNNARCVWVIQAPPGQFVKLDFTKMDIQPPIDTTNGPYCLYDVVLVFNGAETPENLMATFCGSHLPNSVVSSNNSLTVVFATSNVGVGGGFKAKYSLTSTGSTYCNGNYNLTSEGSVVVSGDYPPSHCLWLITAPAGKFVEIHFVSFSIEGAFPVCPWDFLSIRTPNGTTLLRSCGEALPINVTSPGNQVLVEFYADEEVSANGFEFHYRWVSDAGPLPLTCTPDNFLYAPMDSEGYIQDGSAFGFDHELTLNCSWRLLSPPGTSLSLSFLEFSLNDNCDIDHFSLWSGPNKSFPLVGTFCGNNTPAYFTTTNGGLYAEYLSNNAQGKGFLARYAVTGAQVTPASACQGRVNITSANGTSGVLGDGWSGAVPNYPQDCLWLIQAPAGNYVELVVDSFGTEADQDGCRTQYLSAFDGADEKAYPFFSTCGRMTQVGTSFRTTQRSVLVHFSNTDTKLASFRARWQFVSTEGNTTNRRCYENNFLPVAAETRGSIVQTGPLVDMRRGASCAWTVTAPPNARVRSSWSSFRALTQESPGYCGDYVSLTDGDATNRVCSTDSIPADLLSAGSVLKVTMFAVHGLSFNLSWSFEVPPTPRAPTMARMDASGIQDSSGAAGKIVAAVLIPIILIVLLVCGIHCWNNRKASQTRQFDNLDEGQELDEIPPKEQETRRDSA